MTTPQSDPTPESVLSNYLALQAVKGLGSVRLARLLRHFETIEQIFSAGQSELEAVLQCRWPGLQHQLQAAPPARMVDATMDWLEADHHHFIDWRHPLYPPLLREISDPPIGLYVSGDPVCLSSPGLGVVGSRNPSAAGAEHAHRFGRALVDSGLLVTSGMALGVDTAAHQGALSTAGDRVTLAVMGTGLDQVYPAKNRKLAQQLVERGAMISEFPLGSPPLADHFPRRNRIISGLSLGVLVVEAAPRSGSLITARLAAEQGREVFAIPGSIDAPQSRGCHALIRSGAKLVETIWDIAEELGSLVELSAQISLPPATKYDDGISPESGSLLIALGYEPVSVDALVERTGLTSDVISSMLLQLELQQLVSQTSGGRYMRQTNR
ncbi:MAG: DNA-processing protein DprA [Gammaproteobacteria bacterium]|nr:DNA-processing protein DprA [Gammaproteobacteria bacterium]